MRRLSWRLASLKPSPSFDRNDRLRGRDPSGWLPSHLNLRPFGAATSTNRSRGGLLGTRHHKPPWGESDLDLCRVELAAFDVGVRVVPAGLHSHPARSGGHKEPGAPIA